MRNDIANSALPLALPLTRTFDEWSTLGQKLCTAGRKINWLIGDWLIDGSTRFGEKARDEARVIFRSDVDRFDPILKTCRRFPEPRRHQALTFGHHQAVVDVDDTQAEALLDKAETQRLTVPALKAEVRVLTNRQVSMLPDDDPEDAEMRLIAQAWNRASRAARRNFLEAAEECDLGVIEL
jgi:hypothetical protein